MAWKPAPPELVKMFDRVVPANPAIERRKMFGYPAAFTNGNMFAGLHEDRLVLRLGDEAAAEIKRRGAKDFEPMPGRAMRGWVVVPQEILASAALTEGWITRAYHHAAEMPRKTRKTKLKVKAKVKKAARSRRVR
ncbi:MAG TPA: TfoX/Sxy family protein [Candidatus Nitrosopolaris sp.]|nr:TfoX/Sxy family protein [Candidatus Nitrosopolaris sp.]